MTHISGALSAIASTKGNDMLYAIVILFAVAYIIAYLPEMAVWLAKLTGIIAVIAAGAFVVFVSNIR